MEIIEVRNTAEIRRHLNTFVKSDLFHGEDPLLEFSRCYYPTDSDIRNILYCSKIEERKAQDKWQKREPRRLHFV